MDAWANTGGQRTGDYKAGGDFGTVRNTFTRNTTGSLGCGYFGKKAYFNTTVQLTIKAVTAYRSIFAKTIRKRANLRVWRGDVKFNFGYNDPDLGQSAG